MAKKKGGKGRGNNGINNGHLIGQGGGEIKKKPGKTFAEQAKVVKPNTGKSQVEKVGGKKQVDQKWADKIKPTETALAKPNPHKKPVVGKNPQSPSKKPSTPKAPAKPTQKTSPTVAKKKPTIAKPTTPKVVTTKKAPAKSAVTRVKAATKQIIPKKAAPIKARKAPSKGR